MPWLNYRKPEDAVVHKNRYGYFRHLLHRNDVRHEEMEIITETGMKEWPLTVHIIMPIHNHEDLEKVATFSMDMFDHLRGEYGEDEKKSPSDNTVTDDGKFKFKGVPY